MFLGVFIGLGVAVLLLFLTYFIIERIELAEWVDLLFQEAIKEVRKKYRGGR